VTRTLSLAVGALLLGLGALGAELPVWVNGQFAGWCVEARDGVTHAPLRTVAKHLGAYVDFDQTARCVLVADSPDAALEGALLPGKPNVPWVYVNGVPVGTGVVLRDTTYVPLRLVSEALGARVDYSASAGKIGITSKGLEPIPLLPGVPLADTLGRSWPVENTGGMIRFTNAAVLGATFSVGIHVATGFFTKTDKPVTIDFVVVCYGPEGQVVAQQKASLYSVSSGGGDYALEGPFVFGPIASCTISYAAAWVPRASARPRSVPRLTLQMPLGGGLSLQMPLGPAVEGER
jgi:hypothetical protein